MRLLKWLTAAFRSPVSVELQRVRERVDALHEQLDAREIVVGAITDFRALPPRERAARTILTLQRIGRFERTMEARELEDHEVFAGLLLGTAVRR